MKNLGILLLMLLLPACAAPSATREPTFTVLTDENPSSTKQDNTQILFRFERSGGFAGINERWTLFEDGNFISAAGEALAFAPEEIINLIDLISSLDFNKPQTPPRPFDSCADCFRYKLVVIKEGAEYEFIWSDGDGAVQEGLINILTSINTLIFNAAQK